MNINEGNNDIIALWNRLFYTKLKINALYRRHQSIVNALLITRGANADDCFVQCKSQESQSCQGYIYKNKTTGGQCLICTNVCTLGLNTSQFNNISGDCFLYSDDPENVTKMVKQIHDFQGKKYCYLFSFYTS